MSAIQLPENIGKVPFSLSCYHCDGGAHIRDFAHAIKEGWREIRYEEGPLWNYLGECPECALLDPEARANP